MRRQWRPISFLLLATAVAVAPLLAADTTGELDGLVVGPDGHPLGGAVVTASSPIQIGGMLAATTDAEGRFVYTRLTPGAYSVHVTAQGFAARELTGVDVRLDHTTAVKIELPVASFSETVFVQSSPVVDPTQTSLGQTFTRDYIKEVRTSWLDLIAELPGTVPVAAANLYGQRILGSSPDEKVYQVDGIDYTDWENKGAIMSAQLLPFDALQEVNVHTAGLGADSGLTTGGVIEMVTRSGGNNFTGTIDGKYTDSTMERSGDHYDPSDSRHRKLAGTLGGPIQRDRLWFFASYGNTYDRYPIQGATTTPLYDFDNYLAKLTWQPAPSWMLASEYLTAPQLWDAQNSAVNVATEAASRSHDYAHTISADVTDTFSASGYWNARLGSRTFGWRWKPRSVDLLAIQHYNLATNYTSGSFGYQEYFHARQDELAAELDRAASWRGDHQLRLGGQYARPRYDFDACWTGAGFCEEGVEQFRFNDANGPDSAPQARYMLVQPAAGPIRYGGDLSSLFVEDHWRAQPRITLALGLRADRVHWDNHYGSAGHIQDLQPRLGAAWQLTPDGRTVARGSWGRFMHPGNALFASFSGGTEFRQLTWNSCSTFLSTDPLECARAAAAAGLGYRSDPAGWDPAGWFLFPEDSRLGGPVPQVDPNLEPAVQTQWLLGIEREVFRRTGVEISYVRKRLANRYETTCNGNVPTPHPDAACDYAVITNIPEARWDYDGWLLRLESRAWDRLHVLASWVISSSKGTGQVGDGIRRDFDAYPQDYQYRYGYLFDQSRHRVKLDGYVRLDHDVTVAMHGWWQSEYRWSDIEFQPGYGQVYLAPRGNHQGPGAEQIDLQLAKGFVVRDTRLQIIGSVYNVLDNEEPLMGCNFVAGCGPALPSGADSAFTQPRRYEAGLRVEF